MNLVSVLLSAQVERLGATFMRNFVRCWFYETKYLLLKKHGDLFNLFYFYMGKKKILCFLCSGSDKTNFEALFEGIDLSNFFVLLH